MEVVDKRDEIIKNTIKYLKELHKINIKKSNKLNDEAIEITLEMKVLSLNSDNKVEMCQCQRSISQVDYLMKKLYDENRLIDELIKKLSC